MRRSPVTFEDGAQRHGVAQVALLHAVEVSVIEESLRTVDPPAATSHVALVQQTERQPERATNRSRDVTEPDALVMRPRPRFDALLAPTDQVGRATASRSEIVEPERVLDVGRGQVPEGIAPCLALERLPTPISRSGHAQSLAYGHDLAIR